MHWYTLFVSWNIYIYISFLAVTKEMMHWIKLLDWTKQGIWTGMIGGTVMQTFILLWATFCTDWNKEVCSTMNKEELNFSLLLEIEMLTIIYGFWKLSNQYLYMLIQILGHTSKIKKKKEKRRKDNHNEFDHGITTTSSYFQNKSWAS